MSMGIVSDADFERELDNSRSLERAKVVTQKVGRGPKVETPDSIRKLLGGEAVTNGHGAGLALARELGVSESSVSAYQNGATSTASMDRPDPSLLEHVNEAKSNVTIKAREKLTLAIDAITADKLQGASPRVASGVAKDMSTVVKNMEPSSEGVGQNGTQFVFFVPPMKTEQQFKVIDVKE